MAGQPGLGQPNIGPAGNPPPGKTNFNLLAFVAMAFAIVGMIGIFATYAAPLPLERAVARETALDAVLAAAKTPNAEAALAALAALKPQLDDSAGVIAGGVTGIEQRVAEERVAMRARFNADAAATALRLRWLIGTITVMAFVFAITMMGGSIRHR